MKLIINNLTTCTLSNICLTLDKPGLYGIIGRNGTGKSTLFTAINKEMNYEEIFRFLMAGIKVEFHMLRHLIF